MPKIQLIKGRSVGREAVGRDPRRLDRLIVQKAFQQLQGSLFVPPALDREVPDFVLVVDRPPKIHATSTDPADHLVQVPARRGCTPPLLQPPGDQRTELVGPAPDRLVAGVDPPLNEKVLDVPETQAETKVEPQGMAFDARRKPVALEQNRLHERSSAPAAYSRVTGDILEFA